MKMILRTSDSVTHYYALCTDGIKLAQHGVDFVKRSVLILYFPFPLSAVVCK